MTIVTVEPRRRRTYAPALALGVVSTAGLVAALFADGVVDVVGSALLAVPLVVMAAKLRASRRRGG